MKFTAYKFPAGKIQPNLSRGEPRLQVWCVACHTSIQPVYCSTGTGDRKFAIPIAIPVTFYEGLRRDKADPHNLNSFHVSGS